MGEHILQMMPQTRAESPKYTNSSYNSTTTTKKQTTQSKNGQKTLIDILSKKTYKQMVSRYVKDAQHSLIIRKMQIKTTSHWSEWLSLGSPQITNTEKSVGGKGCPLTVFVGM